MRSRRFQFLAAAAFAVAAAALLLATVPVARAASFSVDSTADAVDANPGDGVCDDGAGNCTLRAAVMETNALAGADTIMLPAGVYTLTIIGGGEEGSATGDLDISDELTIAGAGQATTIIDGGGIDRVLHISGRFSREHEGSTNSDGDLTISNVTIRNGNSVGDTFRALGGGVDNAGTLTMRDATISGNVTEQVGGGGLNGSSFSTTTLSSVTVSGNVASGVGGGMTNLGSLDLIDVSVTSNIATGVGGGGIWNAASNITGEVGVLTMTGGSVTDNSSVAGGGIMVAGAWATLITVTVANNSADRGGGIEVRGRVVLGVPRSPTLIISGGSVSGNFAGPGGGLAILGGRTTLTGVEVLSNTSADPVAGGGGIYVQPLPIGGMAFAATVTVVGGLIDRNNAVNGGGISNNGGETTLSGVAITNNIAGVSGGGVVNAAGALGEEALAGTLVIDGGTISRNTANLTTGSGGGILTSIGSTTVSNTTIAENSARFGGGIMTLGGRVTLKNSIVANQSTGDDCGGTLTSDGHNLDSDGSCGLSGNGDLPSEDPLLGPLTDNGGSTPTHALLEGSPAIDIVSIADCTDASGAMLTSDQRGMKRPSGVACDAGAYEFAQAVGSFAGGVPGPGISFAVFSGGSASDLPLAAPAAASFWVTSGGQFIGYLAGSPAFVNRAFLDHFANAIPPNTPLIVLTP